METAHPVFPPWHQRGRPDVAQVWSCRNASREFWDFGALLLQGCMPSAKWECHSIPACPEGCASRAGAQNARPFNKRTEERRPQAIRETRSPSLHFRPMPLLANAGSFPCFPPCAFVLDTSTPQLRHRKALACSRRQTAAFLRKVCFQSPLCRLFSRTARLKCAPGAFAMSLRGRTSRTLSSAHYWFSLVHRTALTELPETPTIGLIPMPASPPISSCAGNSLLPTRTIRRTSQEVPMPWPGLRTASVIDWISLLG